MYEEVALQDVNKRIKAAQQQIRKYKKQDHAEAPCPSVWYWRGYLEAYKEIKEELRAGIFGK
jgi:hypothetical protein